MEILTRIIIIIIYTSDFRAAKNMLGIPIPAILLYSALLYYDITIHHRYHRRCAL